MPNHTRSRWTQDTPNTDGQLNAGIGKWSFSTTIPVVNDVSAGDGKPYYFLGTASSDYFGYCEIGSLIRTGFLATPNDSQEQFGTAALQPGPSNVSGTSDPLAISGYPPFKNSSNPILGSYSGAVKKGFQINWVDVIYGVGTAALTNVAFGLAATNFINAAAPTVQNIINYAANSLPTAASANQANPYVTRINVTTPTFYTTTDSFINATIRLSTGVGGTAVFYGCVFGVSFNFN